jgi:hypothetical protein
VEEMNEEFVFVLFPSSVFQSLHAHACPQLQGSGLSQKHNSAYNVLAGYLCSSDSSWQSHTSDRWLPLGSHLETLFSNYTCVSWCAVCITLILQEIEFQFLVL